MIKIYFKAVFFMRYFLKKSRSNICLLFCGNQLFAVISCCRRVFFFVFVWSFSEWFTLKIFGSMFAINLSCFSMLNLSHGLGQRQLFMSYEQKYVSSVTRCSVTMTQWYLSCTSEKYIRLISKKCGPVTYLQWVTVVTQRKQQIG